MAIPLHPGPLVTTDLDADDPIPEGFVLVDVRSEDEWDAGHAPGAVHIPVDELADRIEDVPDSDVILICRLGRRSAHAAQILAEHGIEAWVLTDGMAAWQSNGLPLVSSDGDIPTIA
ncbi:rhodanese-like domain-containing protein [Flaviflexus huanghaiensis]|uniref:rhodanese-like domain-containing protein n=1 Tax=Flaviflexus huanghaiensis TaxID=1111473 RepID=UPI0015F7C759|nr:rhodanese-like domain-containing protein [Flaviflexus huanghaiensis]